jgi:penicillin amidase
MEDLMFAQGFLVASERMWQMDLLRRLASGRLAEVFGAEALPADRFFRTLGLHRAAQASLQGLEAPYSDYLAAYVRGVNRYRSWSLGRLPLEYRIAGFSPAPWRAEDSLVIAAYMAYMLSFNAREELAYLQVAARVGPVRALELFPTDEGIPAPDYARGLPDYAAGAAQALDELLAMPARWGLPAPGAASNGWAITGRRTVDGEALLANDPHLMPTAPSIWYELELQGPGYHVAGLSLPGVPMVLIGHNEALAWGFTTAMADTQDVFVERLAPDGRHVVREDGAPEPIARRTERIAVKGRAEPETLEVRSTRNGTIINDILGASTRTPMDMPAVATDHLLALRTNSEVPDRSLEGLFRLNRADTLAEARAAFLGFTHASQNLMLAHRDGGIAWQVSGALPRRSRGLGTFPVPGFEGGYGWDGFVPAEQNPGIENPPDGKLVTANNRTLPLDHPVHVSRSWMAPYRALRIDQLLASPAPLGAEDLAHMQLDRTSVQAERVVDALKRLEPGLRELDPDAWRIAEAHLLDWDRRLAGDSPSAALYVLLRAALFRELYGDELGDALAPLMDVAMVSYSGLQEAICRGESSFWDDLRTPERDGPAHIWARSLRAAWAELEAQQGDPETARLDRLQQLVFVHAFDRAGPLEGLFGVGPIGVGGDDSTLNVAKASAEAPERILFIPTYRVVYTPADWARTRGTQTLGQSGHRFSPYRSDQLDDWRAGRTHPLALERSCARHRDRYPDAQARAVTGVVCAWRRPPGPLRWALLANSPQIGSSVPGRSPHKPCLAAIEALVAEGHRRPVSLLPCPPACLFGACGYTRWAFPGDGLVGF